MKLFLTGGFLGSGKTTAIQNACADLMRDRVKVAVITNDQGTELVDSNYIKSFGIPVKEVTGGCFCCNYEKLTTSISTLRETDQPEVIFAESVGSCTDLIATIVKPLAKFYPEISVVISVFADAPLLFSLISGGASFLNDHVRYIYKKQLEEADILIVNKIDLLKVEELQMVQQVIQPGYQDKRILYQDSFNQLNIQQWLAAMNNYALDTKRVSLDLDYDRYATGEAMLAWLDEDLDIFAEDSTACEIAVELICKIESAIRRQHYFIGNLKFLINDGVTNHKISFTALEGGEKVNPSGYPKTKKVSLLINARVQAEPSQLIEIVSNAINGTISQLNNKVVVKKMSAFQPGYPRPAHRIPG